VGKLGSEGLRGRVDCPWPTRNNWFDKSVRTCIKPAAVHSDVCQYANRKLSLKGRSLREEWGETAKSRKGKKKRKGTVFI